MENSERIIERLLETVNEITAKKGLTFKDVAEVLGVNAGYFTDLKRRKINGVPIAILADLCKSYDVSMDYIVNGQLPKFKGETFSRQLVEDEEVDYVAHLPLSKSKRRQLEQLLALDDKFKSQNSAERAV